MKHYTVTAAILTNNQEYLCMQRSKSKFDYISFKYEFPGGKVEEGESLEEGLSRELFEEMNLSISVKQEDFYLTIIHEYPDFKITMHSYLVEINSREFELNEHIDFKWLPVDQLMTLEWAPADIPIVEKLMRD